MFAAIFERFVSFRRIPIRVVLITALASYALQVGAIVQGQPLYIIVLYTLLPWIPLALFEGLWKYEHYSWIAVFAVITGLQIGHLGEHTFQMVELFPLNGVLACPPPVDNDANARRAMDLGLRPPNQPATGISAATLIHYDDTGAPLKDANGLEISGPPACGVFGQLDFETIHLVWDSLVWFGALFLVTRFPRNIWLWIALAAASVHEVEHIFLGYIYFFEAAPAYRIMGEVWATTVQGNIVTGHPVTMQPELVGFYDAGGRSGIMGHGGLVDTLVFNSAGFLPPRPVLHFGYNSVVVIPTVIAFLLQSRHVYDEYLARALPELTEKQLIEATPNLQRLKFAPNALIVRQGDPADRFYILSKGQVEVVRRTRDGADLVVARLGSGQYFGEIGLLHGGKRTASVRAAGDVELMALDREAFIHLMTDSEVSKQQLDRIVRQRVVQLQAIQAAGS